MINKFIYVHILKTAGTSIIHNFIRPVYKERCLYDRMFKIRHRRGNRRFTFNDQLYPHDYEQYDIIFGHFKYDKYEHLNLPMFSFVRHPVDRMISHYYHYNVANIKKGLCPSLIKFSKNWANYMSHMLGDISKYRFIGVVEDFKKSLERMCDTLEVECPQEIVPQRVSEIYTPDDISKTVRKEIENMNLKDMELYNAVIDKYIK